MRVLLCVCLLTGAADAAPKFVVTKWNPGKKQTVKTTAPAAADEQPADASGVAPKRTDCGCGGNAADCKCARQNCNCATCGCKNCGEPAAQLSPQAQAKLTALEQDGVWWDENYLTEAKKPIYGAAERRKCHVFVPVWCPRCPQTKSAVGSGDEELEIVYHTDERGVQGAKYYPAFWNPRTKEFYYNNRLDAAGKMTNEPWINKSLDNLKAEMGIADSIVGSIPAGEIKRELVEKILPVLGWWSSIGVTGPARKIPLGPVSFALPENFSVGWATANGTTKFTPSAAPSIQWSFLLDKKINFIVYDGEQIEFDISRLPNPVLKIVGPKSMESTLPDTPPIAVRTNPMDDVLPAAQVRLPLAVTGNYTYPGDRTRENLINHMMTGQHAGKYTRAQLESMDLRSLEDEHTRDHTRGTQRYAVQPAAPRSSRWVRGTCPTGNCPGRG